MTTGAGNVAVGMKAGEITTGNDNTIVGYYAALSQQLDLIILLLDQMLVILRQVVMIIHLLEDLLDIETTGYQNTAIGKECLKLMVEPTTLGLVRVVAGVTGGDSNTGIELLVILSLLDIKIHL